MVRQWYGDCFFGNTDIPPRKERTMKEVKIYGLCLERLRFQISNAKKRLAASGAACEGLLLECYNTGDPDEIIDILELYDIEDRSMTGVLKKLQDLAYTVSLLLRERIGFGLTGKGELGLYLAAPVKQESVAQAAGEAALAVN